MDTHPASRRCGAMTARSAAAAVALLIIATAAITLGASRWIGATFPGFLMVPNGVIAAVGLGDWPIASASRAKHAVVVAVDGVPVRSSAEVYARVAAHAAGTPIRYALQRGWDSQQVTFASRAFSERDFWLILGGYIINGFIYLGAGLLAPLVDPERPTGRAIFLVGSFGGLYALSGASLYDPGGSAALHAATEVLLAASLVQLAAALAPSPRTKVAALLAWVAACALAVPYVLFLDDPGIYAACNGAACAALGLSGFWLIGTLALERAAGAADARSTAMLVGAALGLGLPAVLMLLSGLTGGQVPVNHVTATAFLFPVSLVWGLAAASRWLESGSLRPRVWGRIAAR